MKLCRASDEVEKMRFDRQAKGHAFDFDRGVCVRCGMTREKYQDSGEPKCTANATGRHETGHKSSAAPVVDPDDL